jgi:sarcosine oxidase subunit gamma
VLWLGPDEWLVVSHDGGPRDIELQLRTALRGLHAAITDVSANRTVIEIAGSHARLVLAKGCPLDLHATRFSRPHVAQTLLARAQMILQCTDDAAQFRLFVRNSLAAYVAQWLLDAAEECFASRSLGTDRVAARLDRGEAVP